MGTARTATGPQVGYLNDVRLIARVSAVGEPRSLPSGDVVVSLRVVVPRPRAGERSRVDTIDVACWSARTRCLAGRLDVGDRVEVRGALRRRFFRSGGGPASRYEVEATSLTRAPALG